MTKLFTRATVSGASLSGANLKAALTTLWDAMSSIGITDATRTTLTSSATLLTTQCGILLVDCSAGSVTLTLPSSGTSTDEAEFKIRRIDSTYANALTVQRGGTDTVEGATTGVTVPAGGQVDFKIPAGSNNWRVTGRTGGSQLAARETLNVPSLNWLDNPDGEVYQRTVAVTSDDNYMDDRWYCLTQAGSITPSRVTSPEDGYAYAMRITQSQAIAQRMGEAQILEGTRTKKLRGKTVTFGGRFKLSASANVRVALLAWTGTEDTVTSDVVLDWTSSLYIANSFFLAANVTVVATASAVMTAATARDVSVTGTIPSGANNLMVFYWTEAAQAQNVTLDAWGRRVVEGGTLVEAERRTEEEETDRAIRFFLRLGGSANFPLGSGVMLAATEPYIYGSFPVMMRGTPTGTATFGGVGFTQVTNSTTSATGTAATIVATPTTYTVDIPLSSTQVANGAVVVRTANSSQFLDFSSDL